MKLTRDHIITYALMFTAMFGIKLTTSLFSIYLDEIGISLANIGIIYAIGGLVGGLVHFPIGELVDTYGRKILLIIGTAGYPIFAIGVAIARSAPQFAALDVMVEFFGTVFWVAIMANLFDVVRKGKEGREISYSNIMIYSAAASAPFIAGFISQLFGFVNLFYISAIIGVSAIPLAFLMREQIPKKKKFKLVNLKKKLVDVFRLYEFKLFAIIDISLNFIWTIWVIYMPIYLENQGFSNSLIGTIVSVNYIAIALLQIPLGKLIDKNQRNASYILIPGFFIMWIAGYAVIAAKKFITIIIYRVCLEIGSELAYDPIHANISHVAPKRMHGGAYSLLTTGTSLAYAFASVVGGFIADKFGIPFVLKMVSILSLIVGVVLIFVKKHKTKLKLSYEKYLKKKRKMK